MPLSREVFEQDGVSGAEPPGGAIADHDLHLPSGEENGVLAARRIVPIAETAVGRTREGDTAGGLLDGPLHGRGEQVQVLKVRLTIRARVTSDKRHGHSSWGPGEGSAVHTALPLVLSRGLSRHTTASTPSGCMPGRAGGMAPNGRTATHTGKYSLSETDVQRSANDANGAWAAAPSRARRVRSGIGERTVAETRSNKDALMPSIPGSRWGQEF